MSKRIPLVFCLASALLLLVACSKSDNSNSATGSNTSTTTTKTTTGTTAGSNTAAPASSPATTTTTAGGGGGEKIGVAECDEFLEKYEACVSGKVPEAARSQYENSIAQWRKSWKQLADNPNTRATLTSVCKSTMEQTKAALSSFGCSF